MAILFSETGFTPIRYRRLILTLRYLLRLLAERETSSKLAPLGIDACRALWCQGRRNWLSDIAHVLQHLYQPMEVTLDDLCSTERVTELLTSVDTMWKDEIVDLITGSPTSSLLASRYLNNHAAPTSFRSYLNICIPAHRVALTRAITGTHDLAIERGKWVGLARQWRLCRMCHDDVEDVIHVLFMCSQQTSCERRDLFLNFISTGYPALLGSCSPERLLHRLIENKDLVEPTARFVHDMFALWKSVPLY